MPIGIITPPFVGVYCPRPYTPPRRMKRRSRTRMSTRFISAVWWTGAILLAVGVLCRNMTLPTAAMLLGSAAMVFSVGMYGCCGIRDGE